MSLKKFTAIKKMAESRNLATLEITYQGTTPASAVGSFGIENCLYINTKIKKLVILVLLGCINSTKPSDKSFPGKICVFT